MNAAFLIKKKSYEKIEYFLRRHPITYIPRLLLFIVSVFLPIALYFMINTIFPNLLSNEKIYAITVIVTSIYYLSILLFSYTNFVEFYLDAWIVTNDRVVDIEQFGLFSRTISELELFRIQDITVDVHGIFATLFKYGTLTIMTASSNLNIVFKNIPSPNKVRQKLLQLANEDFKYHRNET